MFIALIITTIILILVSYHFQTSLMIKHYRDYSTVSDMYALKKYRKSFREGLVYTGLLQIIWVLLIITITGSPLKLGYIIFMYGALGAILLGLFSIKENRIIHYFAGSAYFFCLSIGAAFMAIDSFDQSIVIAVISILHVIFWFLSIPIYIRKSNGTFIIETIHCLLSYSWISLITIYYVAVSI
jgi:hypothetical protein